MGVVGIQWEEPEKRESSGSVVGVWWEFAGSLVGIQWEEPEKGEFEWECGAQQKNVLA